MPDLTLREALDHWRTYETKFIRPLANLGELLQAALQTIEHDLPAAQRELAAITKRIDDRRAEMPKVEAARVEAARQVDAAQAAGQHAQQLIQKELQGVEIQAHTRQDALVAAAAIMEQTAAARQAELETTIHALEQRRDAIQADLVRLEAHFLTRPHE